MLIGMMITISVLVNIADENNKTNPLLPSTHDNSSEVQRPGGPTQGPTQQDIVNEPPAASTTELTADGNWTETDNGIVYTYDIIQNGNNLSIEIYLANQIIGSGYGFNNSGDIELYLNLSNVNTVAKGRLSNNGKNISGTYTIQATGQTGQFSLQR